MKNERSPQTNRVALVSMPWANAGRPSIALGIIKSVLVRADIPASVHYPCIDYAKDLGFTFYDRLAGLEIWPYLGEWLFSRSAFGDDAVGYGTEAVEAWIPHEGVRDELVEYLGPEFAGKLANLREELIPESVRKLAEQFAGCEVLGFTCTFNQIVASIALAREVKRINPSVRILLGGPQCEGVAGSELVRSLPWIDAVFEGEFESGGLELVRWALGERAAPPEGCVHWTDERGGVREATSIAVLEDMDESPLPDYDDYYSAAQGAKDVSGQPIQIGTLPFESARGCWWGRRSHCTFCGLNGGLISFRSKSPERALDDILALSSRYQQVSLAAVDNIIDMQYLRTLLPEMKRRELGLDVFYETKANLKREDVRLLHEAGINVIQPGIESFSSHVLDLMRKGVSAIRNVYLLKLCRQYGITPVYNVLLGFPGETVDDHRHQVDWIERLWHIAPPTESCKFALQRHSPMHNTPDEFGLQNVAPAEGYAHVFPPALVDTERIAFYFDYELDTDDELKRAQKRVTRSVRKWKRRWLRGAREPELVYRNADDFALVIDGRGTQTPRRYVLREWTKAVLLACDDPTPIRRLKADLGIDAEALEETLQELDELKLIVREGDMVLSLVIPHDRRARLPFVPDSLPNQQPAFQREKSTKRSERRTRRKEVATARRG